MTAAITAGFQLELAKLEADSILELWEFDLTDLISPSGDKGSVYRFYSGKNPLDKPLIWQGKEYAPFGVKADGFSNSSKGASNRPSIILGNINGVISGLINTFNQCLGATVIRRKVYARALDAVNFEGGNPYADPTQEVLSYYIIEQLTSQNRNTCTFVLAIPTETDRYNAPNRIVLATCGWAYRSAECGYTGGPVADESDNPTIDPKKDRCSRCLRGCSLRKNERNFGGAILVDKLS